MSNRSLEHWNAIYSTTPADSVSWYQAVPRVSLDLVEKSLAAPASVLDIGGGASTLVDHLIERGYRVGVLDVAAASLDVVRARLATRSDDVTWFVEDITRFASPETWDVWHDRGAFHFLVGADERAAYRTAIEIATRPGSFVIIAAFGPEGPERCSGLPVLRYSPDALQAELGPRYVLLDAEWEMHRTPGGSEQQFVYCRFRRAS